MSKTSLNQGTGDDPLSSDDEYQFKNKQKQNNKKNPQTLQQIIGNKNPKDFAYQQVYERKSTQTRDSAKKNKENLLQNSYGGSGYKAGSRYSHEGTGSDFQVEPSEYTRLSTKLMADVQNNTKHSVQNLIYNPQDLNHVLFKVDKDKEKTRNTGFESQSLDRDKRNSQKMLSERLFQENLDLKNKRDYLQYQHHENEKSKYPFQPNALVTQNSSNSLFNPDHFYHEQEKFSQRKQEDQYKMYQLKMQEEQKYLKQKPEISKKSQQLAAQRISQEGLDVVSRLNQPKQQGPQPQLDESITFQPQISAKSAQIRRDQKIENVLFNDAARRQSQKNASVQNTQDKSITDSQFKQNRNSQKAFINKFCKEFFQVSNHNQVSSRNNVLQYLEMQDVLQIMGFMTNNQNKNSLIGYKVWNELNGKQNDLILKRNLLVFLLAVQNLYYDKIPLNEEIIVNSDKQQFRDQNVSELIRPDDSNENIQVNTPRIKTFKQNDLKNSTSNLQDSSVKKSQRSPNFSEDNQFIQQPKDNYYDEINQKIQNAGGSNDPIGQFDTFGNLTYTFEQVDLIHKNYNQLFMNRLGNKSNELTSPPPEPVQYPHAPQLTENSHRYAESRREKILTHLKNNQPKNVKIDLNYVLCFQKEQGKLQNQLHKQNLEEQELEECSFRPITKDYSTVEKYFNQNKKQVDTEDDFDKYKDPKKGITSTKKVGGIHRTLELHSLGKPRNQRRDKEYEVIEYERDCNECTFSPDISNQIRGNFSSKNISQIRSADKEIQRLQKARLDKALQQEQGNKGTTFNEKKLKNLEQKVHTDLKNSQIKQEKRKSEGVPKQKNAKNNQKMQRYLKAQELLNQDDYRQDSGRSNKDEYDDQPQEMINQQFLQQQQQQQMVNQFQKQHKQPGHGSMGFNDKKNQEEDRVPLLFVDVNIQEGQSSRIVVYEGDESEELATRFAMEHNLDAQMKQKLKELLDLQINSLLSKIDEEVGSEDEENQ